MNAWYKPLVDHNIEVVPSGGTAYGNDNIIDSNYVRERASQVRIFMSESNDLGLSEGDNIGV